MKMKTVDGNFFKTGTSYPFKVYFQLSDTKMLVLFNENTCLEKEDIAKMQSYIEKGKKILLTKEDYVKYYASQIIGDDGKTIGQEAANQLAFSALERQEDLNDQEYLNKVVENTNEIVKNILDKTHNKQSNILIKILKQMESSDNFYMCHSNQVFALATTFLFLMPTPAEIDQLYDLGQGALLHGFALNYLENPKDTTFLESFSINLSTLKRKERDMNYKKIFEMHFYGHEFSTFNDFMVYMESFDIMEKASSTIKTTLSRGVPRMLSEFKNLQIPKTIGIERIKNPYISTRILVIADHTISAISKKIKDNAQQTNDTLIVDCLKHFKEISQTESKTAAGYDIPLIDNLIAKLG